MQVKTVSKVVEVTVTLSIEEAEMLYSSIYLSLDALGVAYAGNRDQFPAADQLFKLYDEMYKVGIGQGGVDELRSRCTKPLVLV